MKKPIQKYQKYIDRYKHVKNSSILNRNKLYEIITQKYNVKSALYPGSYIDITPSLYIEHVIYVDIYPKTKPFFDAQEEILDYLDENKTYREKVKINFYPLNFKEDLPINQEVDLIISQFASFAAYSTIKYLKVGGLVLANDSHADATLINNNPNFKLVGVISHDGIFSDQNLDKYFKTTKNKEINMEEVFSKSTPPKYINNIHNYLFQKIE